MIEVSRSETKQVKLQLRRQVLACIQRSAATWTAQQSNIYIERRNIHSTGYYASVHNTLFSASVDLISNCSHMAIKLEALQVLLHA